MGLDFETDIPFIVECYHPGIIMKDGDAPGLIQFFRRLHDRGFKEPSILRRVISFFQRPSLPLLRRVSV